MRSTLRKDRARSRRAACGAAKADKRYDGWCEAVRVMADSLDPEAGVWGFLRHVEAEARAMGVYAHLRDVAVDALHRGVNGRGVRKPSLPANVPLGVKRPRF